MPAESTARISVERTPDINQLLGPRKKLTGRRHDKQLKAADTLTPSLDSTPNASPTAKPKSIHPHFTDETVILQHGSETDAESFCVRRELLDNLTPFWRGETEPRIILPKIHATIFDMFIDFLNAQRDPVPYLPSQYSAEPWRSYAVDAWFFGDLLSSFNFQRFALSHFIQTCAILGSTVFLRIENDADPKSSLCRFTKHWIAWNHSFAPDGKSEYAHLAAATLATLVTRDTNDPRIYDIDHWYSPCGDDINSSCIHDPIVRENALQELLASRRPVPNEGSQWERDNQPGHETDTPALAPPLDDIKRSVPTATPLPPPPPYTPSGLINPLQTNQTVQALLSSASKFPPPPRPTVPHKPRPNPRPKPRASILSKSSNPALSGFMSTSTATASTGRTAAVTRTVPTPALNSHPRGGMIKPLPPPRLRPSQSNPTLDQALPSSSSQIANPSLRPSRSILISPPRLARKYNFVNDQSFEYMGSQNSSKK